MHFGMNPWAIFTTWLGHYYGGGFQSLFTVTFLPENYPEGGFINVNKQSGIVVLMISQFFLAPSRHGLNHKSIQFGSTTSFH